MMRSRKRNELRIRYIKYLFKTVEKVTLTTKAFPFAYSLVLAIMALCDKWMSQNMALTVEYICFATVPATILCVLMSYFLKLCFWYFVQCFLILLPLSIPICRVYFHGEYLNTIRPAVAVILALPAIIRLYNYFNMEKYKQYKRMKKRRSDLLNLK